MSDDPTPPSVPPVEPVPVAPSVAPPAAPQPPVAPGAQGVPPIPPPYGASQPVYSPPRPDPYAPAVGYQPPPAAYQPPPVGYQPTAPGYSYTPTPAGPARGLAITSMVLGILSVVMVGWGLLPAIAAVITGHIAQKKQPYARPFWITGLITGYIGAASGVILTIVVIIGFVLSVVSPDRYTY